MHVSTNGSPHAHWRALPLGAISGIDGFWGQRQAVNRNVSLWHGYRQLERAGNLNNLRLAAGGGQGEYQIPVFMDSDVYKWLEAVAYELVNGGDAELERVADETIELVAAAQQPDGYLDSYWQVVRPGERWTDLERGHELYCAGHMIEAAVAMKRATGKGRLLDIACRVVDHVMSVFGPGKREAAPGHPEVEFALVELYRETGRNDYLDLASFFVDQRGRGRFRGDGRHFGGEHKQDRVPVREAVGVEGHAVRQTYLTTGVTDLYLETGDPTLMAAMERLWRDATSHKMHITGGLGSRYTGESFGQEYELPADQCYCETCAAIGAIMWNWRMLLATREARYAEILERSLYNGFLSGISLSGDRFFYVNPLQSRGGITRPEWYTCACCPPNVMRQIAMVGHYAATVSDAGMQLHQYMPARVQALLGGARETAVTIETQYPWQGGVRIRIDRADGAPWDLALRVPSWCRGAMVRVNGGGEQQATAGDYLTIGRTWKAGDIVDLDLPLEARLTEPNPRIDGIRGTACIERGPLVYCLEQADQEPGLNLLDVRVGSAPKVDAAWREDLLDGVVTLTFDGQVADPGVWGERLYRPLARPDARYHATRLTAVPYYAWANRGPGPMRVWIPRAE